MSWRPLQILRNLGRGLNITPVHSRAISPAFQTWVDLSLRPALIADVSGRVQYSNQHAQAALPSGELPQAVCAALAKAGATLTAQITNFSTGGQAGKSIDDSRRVFEAHIVPLSGSEADHEPYFMVSARDMTLEVNFTNMLTESRRRYKDLVECSVDFAWETDADGKFCFVSSHGALGYPAKWLDGVHVHSLLEDEDLMATNPFVARERVEDIQIKLKDKDGQLATVSVCALPIHDSGGEWVGARGVCRDITLICEYQEREHILDTLIKAIRDYVDPEEMLREAVRLTAEALHAPLCTVMRCTDQDGVNAVHTYDAGTIDGVHILQKYAERQVTHMVENPTSPVHLLAETSNKGLMMVASLSRHNRRVNGAMCLARPHDVGSWTEKDRLLLQGVTDYIGIAIAQISAQETLKMMARTDELTGLLNRRGFQEHVEPRLVATHRSSRAGALIYIDLDNFKQINDSHGHERGDAVLQALGAYLDRHIRGSDYCARFGGDEFAIWLDETSPEGASNRAEELLAFSAELQKIGGVSDAPLSMSLGIVMTTPSNHNETLSTLLDRADKAMYRVKKDGKASFVIAPQTEAQDQAQIEKIG